MNRKKTGLTYDEHIQIGDQLQATLHALCAVNTKYAPTSKAARLARKTEKIINDLRCELDNMACAENPAAIYPEREPHRIYYGKGILF